jgi:hypothetical protein
MPILTFPTLSRSAPNAFEWALLSNTQTFSSPLTGAVQTTEMPGARWRVAMAMDSLSANDSALLRAFLAQLRGVSGRFYMPNLARPNPRGAATGNPVVSGAGQTGNTLVTSGWSNSITGILRAGDYFGVNDELKMMVADANSNGSGVSTLTFEPPLRSSPLTGATITTVRPTAIFRLEDDASRWTTTAPVLDNFSITAVESW